MMNAMVRPLLAVILVLLAGCVAAPLPPLDRTVPATWRHAPLPPPVTPDLQGWWAGFHDPALDALVARALAENLSLRAAAERLLAVRALHAHAHDTHLPYLRLHSEDAINPNASAAYEVLSFDASWEFELFGRRAGASRLQWADTLDASSAVAGAEVSLVGEVVADYLLLGAAHERFTLLARAGALRQQQLSLLQRRADLGLAALTEVGEAELALAHARADEASAHQQVDAMAQQLALLLGRAAGAGVGGRRSSAAAAVRRHAGRTGGTPAHAARDPASRGCGAGGRRRRGSGPGRPLAECRHRRLDPQVDQHRAQSADGRGFRDRVDWTAARHPAVRLGFAPGATEFADSSAPRGDLGVPRGGAARRRGG
jgi:hypothetical protein